MIVHSIDNSCHYIDGKTEAQREEKSFPWDTQLPESGSNSELCTFNPRTGDNLWSGSSSGYLFVVQLLLLGWGGGSVERGGRQALQL